MIIKVTKQDIKEGVQGDCSHCAIAKALKKHFKDDRVTVGITRIAIGKQQFKTTHKMFNFIEKFDVNKSICKPESFRLIKVK